MQHTYGIFEDEANHLIDLVRGHAPLERIREAGCPTCGAAVSVDFAEHGRGFSIACAGELPHLSVYQEIADPPPWWRECVAEPVDSTFYWQADHAFDASGNLSMPASGYTADGVHWSGGFECAVGEPDYTFWRWVLLESGCTSNLIGDDELERLRAEFMNRVWQIFRGVP